MSDACSKLSISNPGRIYTATGRLCLWAKIQRTACGPQVGGLDGVLPSGPAVCWSQSSPGTSPQTLCDLLVSRIPMLRFSAFLGKLSDIKSTWSSGSASHTQASLSHELWKVPRNTTAPTRPPPGLTNPKPSSAWGASPLGWTSSYSSGTRPFSHPDG